MDLTPSMAYQHHPANGLAYLESISTQGEVIYSGIIVVLDYLFFLLLLCWTFVKEKQYLKKRKAFIIYNNTQELLHKNYVESLWTYA